MASRSKRNDVDDSSRCYQGDEPMKPAHCHVPSVQKMNRLVPLMQSCDLGA
jgi:hypothetical protein